MSAPTGGGNGARPAVPGEGPDIATDGDPGRPRFRIAGERTIRAGRERAWATLTDPLAVAACLPVPATAEMVPPDGFVVAATVTVLLFQLRVAVEGRFVERVEPERAVLRGTAVVPGGGVSVEARLELRADTDTSTTLRWELEASPTGLAATLAGDGGVPAPVLDAVERTLGCLVARAEIIER